MEIIEEALKKGQKTLSEYDSNECSSPTDFRWSGKNWSTAGRGRSRQPRRSGCPVVLKGCSPEIAHKTEKKLIEVDLRTLKEVRAGL